MLTDQEDLQRYTDQAYEAMCKFKRYMDTNGGKIDDRAKSLIGTLDLQISSFLYAVTIYGKNVSAIKWNGKTTLIFGVVATLKLFIHQVSEMTGFHLKSLNQFKQ